MHWRRLLSFSLWIFVYEFSLGLTLCPHEETLEKWSDFKTWENGKPDVNGNVTITKAILLNESPPELFSITIEEGGRLVWSPFADIHLRVHYILIKGSMAIGSDSVGCRHQSKATITLIGEREEYKIPGFDEKFIGVAENGTLELHGQYKHPWTKLNKTLQKFEDGPGLIFRHQDQDGIRRGISGIQVHVFDPITGLSENSSLVRLVWRKDTKFEEAVDQMITSLKEIPDGKVVAMAAQRSIIKHDLTKLFDAVDEVAYGSTSDKRSQLRNIDVNGAWAMITVKGDSTKTDEVLNENVGEADQMAKVRLLMLENKRRFDVSSYIHNRRKFKSEVDFLVTNTDYSMPKLDVVDDVSTWTEGDTLLVTSTDYDWKQAEKAQVVACNECNPYQVRIDLSPKYTHYGEIYKNVDMRAEVALMSHNIKIQGETTDEKEFGGHTKYRKGFKDVHIEGVEFTNMGQQTDLGRYPIHFHMCEDVDTYENPPYIRQNTIHHTHARCTTIHGTHGLRLSDNVCFDSKGHGYFLEDGGEKRTIFERNLGLGQRRGGLIPVDRMPTTFWITNPQTYLRNNVAGGGDGRGFWFTFPDIPVGESATKNFMAEQEARHTAIYEFYNNVAHSYMNTGLFIDNILDENNTARGYNRYQPWQDPLDKNSGPKAVLLDRFTGFKNRIRHIWIRGGLFKLSHFSLSDTIEGLIFLRENRQEQYFTDSVIIGDSPNIGFPSKYRVNGSIITYHRSLPIPRRRSQPRQGIRFFTGPTYISNTWFDGFKDTDEYSAAALTMRNSNNGHSTTMNSVSGLQFGFDDGPTGGNRVKDISDILSFMDNDHIATFRDIDGSVTSVPESQIVPPHPFFMTSLCVTRQNWKMAYCPDIYGLLLVRSTNKNEDVFLKRDDIPNGTDVSSDGEDTTSRFLVILGSTPSYTVFWKHSVPKLIQLVGEGVTRMTTLRVGVCIPRNATFELRGFNLPTRAGMMRRWTEVNSPEDIEDDADGAKYFYDSDVGILIVKLIHRFERSITDKNDCPGGKCATIFIKVNSGDLTDGDCTTRAYPKYQKVLPTEPFLRRRRAAVLSATSVNPPEEWGAGSTRPFLNKNDIRLDNSI